MTAERLLMERVSLAQKAFDTEPDPLRREWHTGYILGLKRARHWAADNYRAGDHLYYWQAAESADPEQAALGRGYRDGIQAIDGASST